VSDDVTTWGGFAELSFLPRTDVVGFVRFDIVRTPDIVEVGDVDRWTAGARYYLFDDVAVHAEGSQRREGIPTEASRHRIERLVTARVDFAF
jgi:hypothetical protein